MLASRQNFVISVLRCVAFTNTINILILKTEKSCSLISILQGKRQYRKHIGRIRKSSESERDKEEKEGQGRPAAHPYTAFTTCQPFFLTLIYLLSLQDDSVIISIVITPII